MGAAVVAATVAAAAVAAVDGMLSSLQKHRVKLNVGLQIIWKTKPSTAATAAAATVAATAAATPPTATAASDNTIHSTPSNRNRNNSKHEKTTKPPQQQLDLGAIFLKERDGPSLTHTLFSEEVQWHLGERLEHSSMNVE